MDSQTLDGTVHWMHGHGNGIAVAVREQRIYELRGRVVHYSGSVRYGICYPVNTRGDAWKLQKVNEIRKDLEQEGYILTEQEFLKLLGHTERKLKIIGKDENYLPLLFPSVVREYFFSIATLAVGILQMEA